MPLEMVFQGSSHNQITMNFQKSGRKLDNFFFMTRFSPATEIFLAELVTTHDLGVQTAYHWASGKEELGLALTACLELVKIK